MSAPPFTCGPKCPAGSTTYEVHTDCGDVTFSVGIIGETKQQARLSYTGVTDEEKLEKIIVSMMVRQPDFGQNGAVFRVETKRPTRMYSKRQHRSVKEATGRRLNAAPTTQSRGSWGVGIGSPLGVHDEEQ